MQRAFAKGQALSRLRLSALLSRQGGSDGQATRVAIAQDGLGAHQQRGCPQLSLRHEVAVLRHLLGWRLAARAVGQHHLASTNDRRVCRGTAPQQLRRVQRQSGHLIGAQLDGSIEINARVRTQLETVCIVGCGQQLVADRERGIVQLVLATCANGHALAAQAQGSRDEFGGLGHGQHMGGVQLYRVALQLDIAGLVVLASRQVALCGLRQSAVAEYHADVGVGQVANLQRSTRVLDFIPPRCTRVCPGGHNGQAILDREFTGCHGHELTARAEHIARRLSRSHDRSAIRIQISLERDAVGIAFNLDAAIGLSGALSTQQHTVGTQGVELIQADALGPCRPRL